MKPDLAAALTDDEAARRLASFFDVLAVWDAGTAAPSPRPPRSLASPGADLDPAAPRRRARRSSQVPS